MPKKSKVRKCEDWEGEMPPGIAPRVAVSIGVVFGWLSFLILFLAFYAEFGFSIYQNLAIFLTSILVALAILGPIWVHYGMEEEARKKKTRKRSTRK